MDALNTMSPDAYEFLKKINPQHWARSHFMHDFKCGMLLNNLCECFNSLILGARTKGTVSLNETIRTKLMCRIQKKRDAMEKWENIFCPRIIKNLEKAKAMSFSYTTTWSGGVQYQVLGNDGQFVANKKSKTYTCRGWQLTGVPCAHAISAIYYSHDKPDNYIHDCYKVFTFLGIYSHILYPTQNKNCWPKSTQCPMIPPQPINKRKGKKTMPRRRDANKEIGFTKGKVSKKGKIITCSICGAAGHNKRFHEQQVIGFYLV